MPNQLSGLKARIRPTAYRLFGVLPNRVRRAVIKAATPSFTVGALAVLHDADEVLFVRQLHRPGLSLPGGLLKKGEPARLALVRELAEEVGLDPAGLSAVPDTAHVDPARRRVDLIWTLKVSRRTLAAQAGAEVSSVAWRAVSDSELTPQTVEILTAIASRLPG